MIVVGAVTGSSARGVASTSATCRPRSPERALRGPTLDRDDVAPSNPRERSGWPTSATIMACWCSCCSLTPSPSSSATVSRGRGPHDRSAATQAVAPATRRAAAAGLRGRRHHQRQPSALPVVFEVRDPRGLLRRLPGSARGHAQRPQERDHGVHRPLWLRQDHGPPVLQPHERPHPGARVPRARSTTTGCPCTARGRPGRGAAPDRDGVPSPTRSPKSIYDNVAYGPACSAPRKRAQLDEVVETSLQKAAVWDEVKDRLKESAMGLSGGQQQRPCIARAIATRPTSCSWTSPARRSTRSPRPASRT